MKRLLICFTVSILAAARLAADFNWKVELGLSSLDAEMEDADLYTLDVTRYSGPLAFSGTTPYSETAFQSRIGSWGFAYGQNEFSDSPNGSQDGDLWGLSYLYREPGSRHIFSAVYSRLSNEQSIEAPGASLRSESETDSFGLAYGYYLKDGWDVGLRVFQLDLSGRARSEVAGGPGTSVTENELDGESTLFGVGSRRLFSVGNSQWLALEVEIDYTDTESRSRVVSADPPRFSLLPGELTQAERFAFFRTGADHESSDEEWRFSLAAVYYPVATTGLSARYSQPDNSIQSSLAVGVTHFFVEAFAAEVEFERVFIDLPGASDVDTLEVGGSLRF